MQSKIVLFVQIFILLIGFCHAKRSSYDKLHYNDFFSNFGYINVNASADANMFYWFFESQDENASAPVILWIQGGPGCSGLMGLFYENGPYSVNDNLQLVPNPNTWNQHYHVLYVDNPVGTGFSYVNSDGYVTNEYQMAVDLYTALTGFFDLNESYKQNDFYIFGESYAGKFIPNIAHYIHKENKKIKDGLGNANDLINLKGFGIGNGLSDPLIQSTAYADYAYAIGLIDTVQKAFVTDMQSQIVNAILEEQWENASNLWDNITLSILIWAGWVNPADIRIFGFPDFNDATNFLNLPEIQAKLGIPKNITFEMCSDTVPQYLAVDQMKSVKFLFPELLGNYKVIFFNGNFDLTIPNNGAEAWINSIPWQGQDAYFNSQRQVWNVQGQVAGFVKQYQSLTQVIVWNAGHMATMDQKQNVLDMVDRFIQNKPFSLAKK